MKIRIGFVSNSSSSSFVLIGVKLNSLELIEEFYNEEIADMDLENGIYFYDNLKEYFEYLLEKELIELNNDKSINITSEILNYINKNNIRLFSVLTYLENVEEDDEMDLEITDNFKNKTLQIVSGVIPS